MGPKHLQILYIYKMISFDLLPNLSKNLPGGSDRGSSRNCHGNDLDFRKKNTELSKCLAETNKYTVVQGVNPKIVEFYQNVPLFPCIAKLYR